MAILGTVPFNNHVLKDNKEVVKNNENEKMLNRKAGEVSEDRAEFSPSSFVFWPFSCPNKKRRNPILKVLEEKWYYGTHDTIRNPSLLPLRDVET
jgi:hypothetical protein